MSPMSGAAEASAVRRYRAKNTWASTSLLGQYTLIPFCVFSVIGSTLLVFKSGVLAGELSGIAILTLVPLDVDFVVFGKSSGASSICN